MRSILSPQISIPVVVTLALGGAMMYGIFEQITMWSWLCWVVAFAFLLGLVLYRLQEIDIDIYNCSFAIGSSEQNLIVVVEGFINSRHPTALRNFDLCLLGWIIGAVDNWSSIPNSINDNGQTFRAVFAVSVEALEEGRINQRAGKAIDIGKIRVATRSGYWLSEPFMIPGGMKLPIGEGWFNNMKGRLIPITKRQKSGTGITKKELHDLLNKASQPVKKSDSEKS